MAMGVGDVSALSGLSGSRKEKTEESENLWTKILADVQSLDKNKLPSCKSVIVLGDNESGKTTLVAKLQCNEDPKKGSGLEYAYIDVRDDYRDEHTRLSVWVLDGDPKHADLLQFAVNADSVADSLVILTISMATPWAIMDQLRTWATILHEHLDTLNLPHDVKQEARQKMTYAWQTYVEPGDEMESATSPLKPPAGGAQRAMEEEEVLLPLPESVLTRNLGIPIIVVVTKTDYMSTLEKDFDYKEEHFDFIQQSIRKFCLQYGASLFYTSVKDDKNCDLLYKYLVHKVYNFPFRTPALVVEKDAVFIPSGWDNEKKIAILYENLHTMSAEDYYTDIIAKPASARKTVVREQEIQAEDEQQFLSKHHSQLSMGVFSMTPTSQGTAPNRSSTPQSQKMVDRRVSAGTSPGQIGSPKKIDATKPGVPGANEGVLANFFNSLLSKKTSTVPSPNTYNDKAARTDAAAELDRLARAAVKNSPTPAVSNNNMEESNNINNTANNIPNNNAASEC